MVQLTKRKGALKFGKGTNKTYRHIELMYFRYIRSVFNFDKRKQLFMIIYPVISTDLIWIAGADIFGLLIHNPDDLQERLLIFQLSSSEETVTKESLLAELCGLIAQINNSSDVVSVCKYQPSLI